LISHVKEKGYVLRASEDLRLLGRKREDVRVSWRKCHYEEFNNLHVSTTTTTTIIIIIIIIIIITTTKSSSLSFLEAT